MVEICIFVIIQKVLRLQSGLNNEMTTKKWGLSHPMPDRTRIPNYQICLGSKWKLKAFFKRQEMIKLIIDCIGHMLPVYGHKTYGSRWYQLQQVMGMVNSGSNSSLAWGWHPYKQYHLYT